MIETTLLQSGQLLRIHALPGTRFRVHRGKVWLTRYDDAEDHVLRPGDRAEVEREGLVLVSPLEPSLLELYRADPRGVRERIQRSAEAERTRALWQALRTAFAALLGRR